jgi:hypothetical protein
METAMNSCSMTTVPKCAITPRAGVVAPRLASRSLKASPVVARPASILPSKRSTISVRTAAAAPVAEQVSQVGHTHDTDALRECEMFAKNVETA